VRTLGGPRSASAPQPSSARAIARYLIGLRPILHDACAVRNDWVKRLGVLIDEARSGDVSRVSRGAGQLGRDFGDQFRNVRSRIDLLAPPPECDVCQAAVRAWAAALMTSCDALNNVGRTGQLQGLRVAQERLADARTQAHRFNDEYARLATDLRRRVATARRRADRLPTRRQASPS
jgi:hypothetical protein